jgi:hypothetical protein
MMAVTYLAEIWGELTLTSMFGQIWVLPFLVYLFVVNTSEANRWVVWLVATLLLSYPSGTLYLSLDLHLAPESTLARKRWHYSKLIRLSQHTQSKSAGTLAIPTPFVPVPSLLPAITCLCKRAGSSLQTSIVQVNSPFSNLSHAVNS